MVACLLACGLGRVGLGWVGCVVGLIVYPMSPVRLCLTLICRTFVYSCPHSVYEFAKLELTRAQGYDDSSKLSPVAVLTAGGLAGMANWIVSIPPDTLKSRYQSAPQGKYASLLDVYRQLMRTEGPGALFAGIRPALIRAFPANAACFAGMEFARSTLSFLD